jgi:hypothetical protein
MPGSNKPAVPEVLVGMKTTNRVGTLPAAGIIHSLSIMEEIGRAIRFLSGSELTASVNVGLLGFL